MASGSVVGPASNPTAEPAPSITSGIPVTISRGLTDDQRSAAQSAPEQVPICGTGFGTPGSDAALSWDDTAGIYVTAGAADFYCPSTFTITSVDVMGYYGPPSGSGAYDVTVYYDSGGEPNNLSPKCATQTVTGTASGQYGNLQQFTLPLSQPCTVSAGTYWLEVQEVDPNDPWYWQTQTNLGGTFDADWREYGTYWLSTPCTAGYLDGYHMQDCLFYTGEPDLMFVLTGDPPGPCATADQITPLFASGFGAPARTSNSGPTGADDFACAGPASGLSEVRSVTWRGAYSGCVQYQTCGPANEFVVSIYDDDPFGNSHEPGAQLVCRAELRYKPLYTPPAMPGSFQETGTPNTLGPKTFQGTLRDPCTVTNNTTYWISIAPKIGNVPVWKWALGYLGGISQVANLYPADWRKSVSSCPTWNNSTYLSTCLSLPPKNLMFRIN